MGQHAHTKALRFKQSSNECGAKAGVIDVGIAADNHDIAGVPAQLLHLAARHWQRRSGLPAGARGGITEDAGGLFERGGRDCTCDLTEVLIGHQAGIDRANHTLLQRATANAPRRAQRVLCHELHLPKEIAFSIPITVTAKRSRCSEPKKT